MAARLTAATRGGSPHDEELTATAGSWRGAASTIAGKVGSFVDSHRAAIGGPSPTTVQDTRTAATPSAIPPPSPPPLPPAKTAPPATATAAPPTTATAPANAPRAASGGRTVEDGILDWVRLNDGETRSIQTPIYMRLFSTDKTNLGTGGEGGKETRASEAKTLQGQGPALLRETFLAKAGAAGLKVSAYDEATAADVPSTAIVIEGEFVTIDPGSRAKRYFVGFGSGKSAIEIAGRFVTKAGETMGEFRHRRIGAMGVAGGDSLGKLLSDTRSCGEDIAKFLEAWLANKPLK